MESDDESKDRIIKKLTLPPTEEVREEFRLLKLEVLERNERGEKINFSDLVAERLRAFRAQQAASSKPVRKRPK